MYLSWPYEYKWTFSTLKLLLVTCVFLDGLFPCHETSRSDFRAFSHNFPHYHSNFLADFFFFL